MRRHFRWDKKYLYWGVTAFLVIAASVLFFFVLQNFPWLRQALAKIGKILSPFIWGFVITYLIAPLMKLLERRVFAPLCKRLFRKSKKNDGSKLARALSALDERIKQGERPVCAIEYFVPDEKKAGGKVVTVQAAVRRIDPVLRRLVLAGQKAEEIDLDCVVRIAAEEPEE